MENTIYDKTAQKALVDQANGIMRQMPSIVSNEYNAQIAAIRVQVAKLRSLALALEQYDNIEEAKPFLERFEIFISVMRIQRKHYTQQKMGFHQIGGNDMADIAIITGATGGIGMEFVKAIHMMDDIDEIWAVGRNKEKLKCLKKEYEKVVPIEADFAGNGISILGERIETEKPNIRMLINNAGIAHMGAFEEMKKEDIDDFCKINCNAPSLLISIALPYMSTGARILNIASASSFQPNPYLSMYSASKVFLKNLSRALSVELKPRGITVTAVCPGWVDTGMLPKEKNGRPIRYIGMVKPSTVVNKALRDSCHGKDMSTPGFFAGYFRFYSKITPTKLVMKQWASITKKYL